jgi:hypothetical protein
MEPLEIGQLEFVIIILKIAHSVGEITIIQAVQTYAQDQSHGILLEIILQSCAKRNALTDMRIIIRVEELALTFAQALIMQTEFQLELITRMEIMIQKDVFCFA